MVNSKAREIEAFIEREIAEWPGASVEFREGKKHPRARIAHGGNMLSVTYSGTTGSRGSWQATIGDIRRALKQLGAQRDKPEPSPEEEKAIYAPPNDGKTKRPDPVKAEKAAPQPDIADQLVGAGMATPTQASLARTERERETAAVPDEAQTQEEADQEARLLALRDRIEGIEDGIYFGLPDEIYHAVAALGSGSLVDLLVSAGTFWRGSWLDPDRPEFDEDATKAQTLGKAYHCARLEPAHFETRFVRELDKADFPRKGFLAGGTEIGNALAELGETKKKAGEKVIEQAQRLEDLGYPDAIWPLELARWEEQVGARQPIPAKYWDDILIDMQRIRDTPDIAALLDGGAPEVSVFWRDKDGVRCKARFDKLQAFGWIDFKTFVNQRGLPLSQCIADAFRYRGHYIQAVHYRDGFQAIVDGLPVREGVAEDHALIEKIQGDYAGGERRPECWYVFQEKGGIPNLVARRFLFRAVDIYRDHEIRALIEDPDKAALLRDSMEQKTMIAQKGKIEIARAKRIFAEYSQVYQPGEPWKPFDPMGTIGDLDFHPRWLEGEFR